MVAAKHALGFVMLAIIASGVAAEIPAGTLLDLNSSLKMYKLHLIHKAMMINAQGITFDSIQI
jgi:hypothetical protein